MCQMAQKRALAEKANAIYHTYTIAAAKKADATIHAQHMEVGSYREGACTDNISTPQLPIQNT